MVENHTTHDYLFGFRFVFVLFGQRIKNEFVWSQFEIGVSKFVRQIFDRFPIK